MGRTGAAARAECHASPPAQRGSLPAMRVLRSTLAHTRILKKKGLPRSPTVPRPAAAAPVEARNPMRALDNGVAGTAVADLSASPAACGVAGPRGWHVVVQGHEEELNAPLDNDSLDVESASSTRVAGDGAPL